MKTIALAILSLLSLQTHASPTFTYSEMLIKKGYLSTPVAISFTSYMSVKLWCMKTGTAFDIGSFEAAKDLEKLDNGFFKCKGKFARLPFEPIKAFEIESCSEVDTGELQVQCEQYQ